MKQFSGLIGTQPDHTQCLCTPAPANYGARPTHSVVGSCESETRINLVNSEIQGGRLSPHCPLLLPSSLQPLHPPSLALMLAGYLLGFTG